MSGISRSKLRRRNIWFNCPYSNNLSTNIIRKLLMLLDKHLPKSNSLHKIFNRNNVKMSFSFMYNFGTIINSHKKIMNNSILKPSVPSCNCRVNDSWFFSGPCLQSSLVYVSKAKAPNITKNKPHDISLTENTFNDRFYKCKNSFK